MGGMLNQKCSIALTLSRKRCLTLEMVRNLDRELRILDRDADRALSCTKT
ncbi:MAG: hypothetical protein JGK07_15335 [Microcoleus sp. PH2017_24_DOB_U_A]|nr:hypothetical protein [Microcoleus sp. PH2017_08_TRC_O_A]MCC3547812.1 hypothetical protein [Microcoleus sp. PH2017_24_DOB_U_A]